MKTKLTSGRFLFTIACAVAFLYGVFSKTLSADVIERIITVVLVFYFTKKDNNDTRLDTNGVTKENR